MPQYIKAADVKIRLLGKVQFTSDPCDENKMQDALLTRLIDEAESEVEQDLSPRYMAPFQTDGGGKFDTLPARPTRDMIRMLCELKAVERVIETDFGRGSSVNGEEYSKKIKERYDANLAKLLEYRQGQFGHFKYPPLPSLRLNFHNTEADDGYAGSVIVSGEQFSGDFPSRRINDPSQNLWTGDLSREPEF